MCLVSLIIPTTTTICGGHMDKNKKQATVFGFHKKTG